MSASCTFELTTMALHDRQSVSGPCGLTVTVFSRLASGYCFKAPAGSANVRLSHRGKVPLLSPKN